MRGSFPCWTWRELVSSALRSLRLTQLVPICSMAPQRALNMIDWTLLHVCTGEWKDFFNWNDHVTYLPLQRRLWPRGWTDLLRRCCRRPLSLQTGSEVQCCHFCKYTWMRQVMPELSGSKCWCQQGGTPQRSQNPRRSGVPRKLAACAKWHDWPQITEIYLNVLVYICIQTFRGNKVAFSVSEFHPYDIREKKNPK